MVLRNPRRTAALLPLVLATPFFLPAAMAEFDPVPRVLYSTLPPLSGTTGGSGARTILSSCVGDLDADGHPDLVVLYAGVGVCWFHSLGSHDLTREQPLAPCELITNLSFRSLLVTDVDQDGYPDLVGSLQQTSSGGTTPPVQTVWLRNLYGETGQLSFDPAPRVIYTNNALPIDAQDINRDGRPDILTPLESSNSLVVSFNKNTGGAVTFSSGNLLATGAKYNLSVPPTLQDVDGDGDLDVLVDAYDPSSPVSSDPTNPQKSNPAWVENRITDVSGFTLDLRGDVASDADLPASSTTSKLVVARIDGIRHFRFLEAGRTAVDFREDRPGTDPQKLARLMDLLQQMQGGAAPADGARLLVYQAANVFPFVNQTTAAPVLHRLPVSASSSIVWAGDFDGDGDQDLLVRAYPEATGSTTTFIWYENRLNESGHADFIERRRETLPLSYFRNTRSAPGLKDFSGHPGNPGLFGWSTVYGYAVVLQNLGEMMNDSSASPRFDVLADSFAPEYNPAIQEILFCGALDLDGDGDLDVVLDPGYTSYIGGILDIYQNRSGEKPGPFPKRPLIVGASSGSSAPDTLKAADGNGDGLPEIYGERSGSQRVFRNDFATGPAYGLVADASLPWQDLPGNPQADALLADFEAWVTALPWQPVSLTPRYNGTFPRLAADVDGDGDLDVISFTQDTFFMRTTVGLVWYENVTPPGGPAAFRGPLGISDDVMPTARAVCVDIDGDGDQDLLMFSRSVLDKDSVGIRVYPQLFLNRTAPPKDAALAGLTADPVVTASVGYSNFTAAMQASDDMVHWDAAVSIPPQDLLNPAAMKDHLQWKDASRPQRFYRMIYTTTP